MRAQQTRRQELETHAEDSEDKHDREENATHAVNVRSAPQGVSCKA
jgi:hypothetical protein